MKKVGIMGGTFNPIHCGHLKLALAAFEQYLLDEVLFMPCGNAYMKEDQNIESGQIRAEMTALAIRENPNFKLSTLEIEQPGNTYTYQTLEHLKKENPDAKYYFIMGADSLFNITRWASPKRIFSNCCILAAVRDDKTIDDMEDRIRMLKQEYDADIRMLQTPFMDISSSDIRRKISEGKPIDSYVPEDVRTYIEKRGLYR